MKIGTIFLGHVDRIENEFITTKFFIFGIPLIPLESYYADSESSRGINGFIIPHNLKSIIVGYTRIPLLAVACVRGLLAFSYPTTRGIVQAVLLFALWFFIAFVLGKISKRELAKRMVMKTYTGIYANPNILPDYRRKKFNDYLKNLWLDTTLKEWDGNIDENEMTNVEVQELAYTLARYEGLEKLAEQIWQKYHLK